MINRKARLTAFALGMLMLILNLLLYVYLLANELHDPGIWTAAMLNLAITCGVFIAADHLRMKADNEKLF